MSTQIDPLRLQIADRLKKKFGLQHIEPIHVTTRVGESPELIRTYYQAWLNDRKIFIKHFGNAYRKSAAENEFLFSEQLHKINADNFPEVLFRSESNDYRCLAAEFLEGETLKDKMRSTSFPPSERMSVIIQLKDIAKSLLESCIVHRDLKLKNFFITNDGSLKLIDFGGAVDSKRYEKIYAVSKNPVLLLPIWGTRLAGACCSDDMVGILKILEDIGCHESYQETYDNVESFLRDNIKEKSFRHTLRHIRHSNISRMLRRLEHRIKLVMRPFFYHSKRIGVHYSLQCFRSIRRWLGR